MRVLDATDSAALAPYFLQETNINRKKMATGQLTKVEICKSYTTRKSARGAQITTGPTNNETPNIKLEDIIMMLDSLNKKVDMVQTLLLQLVANHNGCQCRGQVVTSTPRKGASVVNRSRLSSHNSSGSSSFLDLFPDRSPIKPKKRRISSASHSDEHSTKQMQPVVVLQTLSTSNTPVKSTRVGKKPRTYKPVSDVSSRGRRRIPPVNYWDGADDIM